MADVTYENIPNPYNSDLTRASTQTSMNDVTDVAQNEGGRTIKTGSTLTDCWIDTWIKSSNYSPKKKGFFLDALNGYIETENFAIGTGIEMYGNDAYFYDSSSGGKGISNAFVTNGGTGYAVGNILSVQQTGATGGQLKVTSVDAGTGAVTGTIVNTAGSGYVIGTGYSTTGGAGTGALVNVSALTSAGSISGDTSSFVFARSFYPDQEFLIQKRVGINSAADNASDNVMEFFYPNPAQSGRKNYLFLGTKGNATGINDYNTNVSELVAKDLIQIYSSKTEDHSDWPLIYRPTPEIQIVTDTWNSSNAPAAGGSNVVLGAIDTDDGFDYLHHGACVVIGIQQSGGFNSGLIIDNNNCWLGNNFLPVSNGGYTLGGSHAGISYGFAGLYLSGGGSFKELTNNAGTLNWDGAPVGGAFYGPFIVTSDGLPPASSNIRGYMDTDGSVFRVYPYGRDMVIGTSGFNVLADFGSSPSTVNGIAPKSSGSGNCGTSSRFWANVYANNYNLSATYINFESGAITFHSQTNTTGSISATGDLKANSSSGSCIIGSSGGYLVSRGKYCYAQSITYKDGSGTNQTKFFMVA
jgi:hypothetical protein